MLKGKIKFRISVQKEGSSWSAKEERENERRNGKRELTDTEGGEREGRRKEKSTEELQCLLAILAC